MISAWVTSKAAKNRKAARPVAESGFHQATGDVVLIDRTNFVHTARAPESSKSLWNRHIKRGERSPNGVLTHIPQ